MAKTYGEGGLFYDKTTAGGTPTAIKSFYGGSAVPEPLKFSTLVYPKDLNPDNFYPDCICFTIQKRTGVSIDDFVAAGSAGVEKVKGEFAKLRGKFEPDLKKLMDDAIKKFKGKATEIQILEAQNEVVEKYKETHPDFKLDPGFIEAIGNGIKEAAIVIGQKKTKALTRGTEGKNILGSIYMNMPSGITFNEKANWSGSGLGFMGKMTQDFVGSGTGDLVKTLTGAAAGSAGGMVGAAIGALPSLVSKLGISGGMFGMAIGAMAAGGPLQQGAESALGVAQNPYMEMMFSGIGFRAFQFEFIMRPKNTDEVDEVAEILNVFRTFTKPTFVEGSLGKSFMDYPMEFQIEFLTSGDKADQGPEARRGGMDFETNPHVPKIKTCVCDNVTSNYTPQSIWAAHEDGVPVAVNLSLSFQETELVMAEDVYYMGY